MSSFDVAPQLLVVATDRYPHFGVNANGNAPRGFVFAQDPAKNATFLAFAAIAKATGKKLRVFYTTSNLNRPSIEGVMKVDIIW